VIGLTAPRLALASPLTAGQARKKRRYGLVLSTNLSVAVTWRFGGGQEPELDGRRKNVVSRTSPLALKPTKLTRFQSCSDASSRRGLDIPGASTLSGSRYPRRSGQLH
jgi:hypothetical protein